MRKSGSHTLRAFIAAPAQENLDSLKNELNKRNISVFTAYDTALTTSSLATNVQRAIEDADLVIGVVPEKHSSNVFFELGMAHALSKPVILLVSPKYGDFPSDLSGALYLRANPNNTEAIGFALDQCIERLRKPIRRRHKPPKEGQPLGNEADAFLSQIGGGRGNLRGAALESLVVEILRAAGVEAISQSKQADLSADIAVWSDALQTIAGNPLLIEVKSHIQSTQQLLDSVSQMDQYRIGSGSRLALLIVNTALISLSTAPFLGGVLTISLMDFVDKLRVKSFADTIRELRNQHVHGGIK